MEMQLEVSEEYLQFLYDIEDKGFLNGCYMDETEYDEYSHIGHSRKYELYYLSRLRQKAFDFRRQSG